MAVATLAHETCQLHPGLNSDLLICAALVHDLGRTREFTYGAEIGLTDEGRLLGHLVIGERMLSERSAGVLDDERRLALLHCVLCHHGPASAPGGRFASHRGAGAVPAQRGGRGDQGRAGARARRRLSAARTARRRRRASSARARRILTAQSTRSAARVRRRESC